MKMLLLSIFSGSNGEKSVQSLKDYIESEYKDCIVLAIDVLSFIKPDVEKIFDNIDLGNIRKSFGTYICADNDDKSGKPLSKLDRNLKDSLSNKIQDIIEQFYPDAIVAAHPFVVEILSVIRKNINMQVPVISLITEYYLDKFWIYDFIDAYIIPNEDFKHEMVICGADESKIFPYGIPVGKCFLDDVNRKAVLDSLGFDDRETVLVISSGFDFQKIKEICLSIANSFSEIQIIVITNGSIKLKKQLAEILKGYKGRHKVFCTSNDIPKLMSISSLLVTKPDSLTASQAMIKRLPMAIIPPTSGREESKYNYHIKSGTAVGLEVDAIPELIKDGTKLNAMKSNEHLKAKPYAARDSAKLIMELIYKNRSRNTKANMD